ncbi:DUF3906 family protein [Alkalihalophilus lindianensis]|uniref:DUF3906 family protein n=1 Tax=Alkalihalophilus lindianensis TaxID=1630542 RepID=A0ABU3X7L5_9BACI|nr:DUF3906 family protein [Alkalihalophilus lindianensis]MDV2683268.1 DUF3906 family protein [Alkalihalophilus lindianensis]
MQLYRFEVETTETTDQVVVIAQSEEEAFRVAEIEVEKHYLKLPEINEVTLLERKAVHKATGFVIS